MPERRSSVFIGQVEKRLDLKDEASFKVYDVTTGETQLQYTYCPISISILSNIAQNQTIKILSGKRTT